MNWTFKYFFQNVYLLVSRSSLLCCLLLSHCMVLIEPDYFPLSISELTLNLSQNLSFIYNRNYPSSLTGLILHLSQDLSFIYNRNYPSSLSGLILHLSQDLSFIYFRTYPSSLKRMILHDSSSISGWIDLSSEGEGNYRMTQTFYSDWLINSSKEKCRQ